MSKRKPTPLGNALSMLLRNIGIENKVKEYEALARWPEFVGERVSQVTQTDHIINGILFVRVNSSSWRTELIFMKHEILKKMDEKIGAGIVRDIRFI